MAGYGREETSRGLLGISVRHLAVLDTLEPALRYDSRGEFEGGKDEDSVGDRGIFNGSPPGWVQRETRQRELRPQQELPF